MDIAALSAELIAGHPDTGPYDADAEVATDQLNLVNRTTNKDTMTASEVYNAINSTQWVALTDAARQEVWDILHFGEINPFGFEQTRFVAIFGGGSATINALAASRVNNVSRAVELGLGLIKVGYVEQARV